MKKLSQDEKIAVGVALVIVAALFVTFIPAFWSDAASGAAPAQEFDTSLR